MHASWKHPWCYFYCFLKNPHCLPDQSNTEGSSLKCWERKEDSGTTWKLASKSGLKYPHSVKLALDLRYFQHCMMAYSSTAITWVSCLVSIKNHMGGCHISTFPYRMTGWHTIQRALWVMWIWFCSKLCPMSFYFKQSKNSSSNKQQLLPCLSHYLACLHININCCPCLKLSPWYNMFSLLCSFKSLLRSHLPDVPWPWLLLTALL